MATSYENARAICEYRFNNQWNGHTPIHWENVDFNPPDPAAPWVRFTVIDGAENAISIGSPGSVRYRHIGVMVVQVFTPQGTGTTEARALADSVAAIFRGQTFDGVTAHGANIEKIGVNNGWYQLNVTIPFRWDAVY